MSAETTAPLPADYPPYTLDDLDSALCIWQLDAVRIASIAEDFPAEALEDRCNVMFGKDGDQVADFIVHMNSVEPGDAEAFERALLYSGEFGTD